MDPWPEAVLAAILGLAIWGVKSRFDGIDNLIQNHLMHRMDVLEERFNELLAELRKRS